MVNDTSADKSASSYVKIANFKGLYRHTTSGRYYGVKKVRGKRREVSLRTADRAIAERRLREWVANLGRIDLEKERTTFKQLIAMFVATNLGKSKSTQTKHRAIIKTLRQFWRDIYNEIQEETGDKFGNNLDENDRAGWEDNMNKD